ncbi:MAG: SdrD B-like domain-containing protein [Acidimicrobiales bacterium]
MRRSLVLTALMAVLAATLVIAPIGQQPAWGVPVSAGPVSINEATVVPAPPGAPGTPLGPGATVQYVLNYDCSAVVGDTCQGATLTYTLPTFTDVYGNPAALLFDGWVPTSDWTGPNQSTPGQVTWTGSPTFGPGDSGTLAFTLRVPPGIVPAGEFTLSSEALLSFAGNDAAVDLPDPIIGAASSATSIAKTGSANQSVLRTPASDAINHTVQVCPAAGAALWPRHVVTDTLAPGAELIDPGSLPAYATYDAGAGTIVWNLDPGPSPSASTGCIELFYSVNYPNDINAVGDVKVNTVVAVPYDENGDPQDEIGPAAHTVTLISPPVGWGRTKTTTDGDYFVLLGDEVAYRLGTNNTSDVDAPGFDSTTITDTLPVQFTLTQIDTGTWDDLGLDGSASIQVSTNGTDWIPVATAPGQSVDSLSAGIDFATVTHVRWVFHSPSAAMDRGWRAQNQLLTGTVNGNGLDLFENCAAFSAAGTGVGPVTGGACASMQRETPQPHPQIAKTTPAPSANPQPSPFEDPLPANTLLPGQTITYTISANNNADATGELTAPQIRDCVPDAAHLTVGAITYGTGTGTWTAQHGTLDADATAAGDCATAGGTYLQFQLNTDLLPGQSAPVISYEVTALGWTEDDPATTPPGPRTNTATIQAIGGTPISHCVGGGAPGTPAVDDQCSNSHTIAVPAFAQLDSRKLVRGANDSGFNLAGTTTPGGQVTWRLQVRNVGNVSVEDVHYVDIFPHVGDTGVRRPDQPRGSQYDPYLVSTIDTPEGWTVEYSTSLNPCRPEVRGPQNAGTNCDTPNWTDTPNPAALSSYRSIRLRYVGSGGDGGVIPVGGPPATFEFNMVTPVFDPSYADGSDAYGALLECTIPVSTPAYDPAAQTGGPGASTLGRTQSASPTCPVASNSFAYGVRVPPAQWGGLPDPGILAAEPPKVDLHVVATDGPGGNGIGDRVWYDRDLDGTQDPDEVGVPGVRVELYRVVGGARELIDTTFTDANGNYLFVSDPLDLPDGTYVVRFYPPADHDVSPRSQGPDRSVDSDVPRQPTSPGGAVPPSTTGGPFHETNPIPLSGGMVDLTWDMGIWHGGEADIDLDKVTKDSVLDDSEAGDGVEIVEGRPVTWIYTITNTGHARLENVTLDDDGGPDPGFSVTACAVVDDGVNLDGLSSSATAPMALNRGAVLRCTAEGTAIDGLYENVAVVTGEPRREDGSVPLPEYADPVDDSDPSSYTGVAPGTYAVGDVVWLDLDRDGIQGPDEPGVAGITVELLDADGEPITDGDGLPRVTTTDANGRYVFDDLPAGSYRIRFSGVPDGYEFTGRHAGDVRLDSDADHLGMTPVFELGLLAENMRPVRAGDGTGEVLLASLIDPTIDAGIFRTPVDPADLTIDKVVDVDTVVTGGIVTWTVTVSNIGAGPDTEVVMVDTLPDGLVLVAVPAGASYDADTRQITWAIGDMAPGQVESISYETQVTASAGATLTNTAGINSASVSVGGLEVEPAESTIGVSALPRTGASALPVVLAGMGAILLGAFALVTTRRRLA